MEGHPARTRRQGRFGRDSAGHGNCFCPPTIYIGMCSCTTPRGPLRAYTVAQHIWTFATLFAKNQSDDLRLSRHFALLRNMDRWLEVYRLQADIIDPLLIPLRCNPGGGVDTIPVQLHAAAETLIIIFRATYCHRRRPHRPGVENNDPHGAGYIGCDRRQPNHGTDRGGCTAHENLKAEAGTFPKSWVKCTLEQYSSTLGVWRASPPSARPPATRRASSVRQPYMCIVYMCLTVPVV